MQRMKGSFMGDNSPDGVNMYVGNISAVCVLENHPV